MSTPSNLGGVLGVLTLQATVQSYMEDLDNLTSSKKGKEREGTATDTQIALQLYEEELRGCKALLDDRRFAQSMPLAVLQDGAVIEQELRLASQCNRDRDMAQSLATNDSLEVIPGHKDASADKKEDVDPWSDTELLSKAAALYVTGPDNSWLDHDISGTASDVEGKAESSSQAATRATKKPTPKSQCASCSMDIDFYDVAPIACNHEYCRECLAALFTLSMADEALFPPRCCRQEMSLPRVRFFLPSQLAKTFEARYTELSTENGTYCHDVTCSTFIPFDAITEEIGTCPQCGKTTCVTCRATSHTGDCLQDEKLRQLVETAEDQQWQRCYQCHRIIELEQGCHHITCRCGAQLCYVCGAQWKQCDCPQWHEAGLLARAAQIVDRDPRCRLYEPPCVAQQQPLDDAEASTSTVSETADAERERRQHIADAMEDLLAHECEHERWRYVRGRHTCEECEQCLPRFIYECRRCHLQACRRCKMNRL